MQNSPFKLSKNSLYQIWTSLGQDDLSRDQALIEILEAFYNNQAKDLMIGFFFNDKDLSKIAFKQAQFLKKAWGVSPSYSGLAPSQAHKNLAPILEGHFNRRLVLLEQTLTQKSVKPEHIKSWIQFERSFEGLV